MRLAAAAGNAPALPVSETGVQTSTLSGKMVAREGSAPPISGCRPDVILFHHRAVPNKECRMKSAELEDGRKRTHRTQRKKSRAKGNANGETRLLTFCILRSSFFILKMAAGDGFAPPQSPSKGDVLLVRRPGIQRCLRANARPEPDLR